MTNTIKNVLIGGAVALTALVLGAKSKKVQSMVNSAEQTGRCAVAGLKSKFGKKTEEVEAPVEAADAPVVEEPDGEESEQPVN